MDGVPQSRDRRSFFMDLTLRRAKGFVQNKLRGSSGIWPHLIWSARTCPRFQSGDASPQSKYTIPIFYRQTAACLLVVSHQDRRSLGHCPVAAAILAAVSPGFQPGGPMRKRSYDVGLVLWSGRQDAAGYGRQGCPPLQNWWQCLNVLVNDAAGNLE
jgi:hypothetical protein